MPLLQYQPREFFTHKQKYRDAIIPTPSLQMLKVVINSSDTLESAATKLCQRLRMDEENIRTRKYYEEIIKDAQYKYGLRKFPVKQKQLRLSLSDMLAFFDVKEL